MAITSLDGALAGMQPTRTIIKAASAAPVAGRPMSTWSLAGVPGPGSFSVAVNGSTLSSTSAQVAGQIPHTDPGSGNAYLARFAATMTQPGLLMLCDRLWHNGGLTITSTSTQTFASGALPARDATGTTTGVGVKLAVEVSANCGAAAPTLTVGYTNTGGTAGQTGTNVFATANSSLVGSFYEIGLAAGDVGVQSVQSFKLSVSQVTGTMNVVAYRVLAALELPGAFVPNSVDALTSGMPQIFNGCVPFLVFVPSTTTATNVTATYTETQG